VVVIAGVVAAIIFLFQNIMSSGSAEATAFVDDIKNNRLTEAYDRFSPQLKEVQDFKTFSYQIGTLGLDPSCNYKPNSAEINSGTDGNTKETAGDIECASKSFTAKFSLTLVNNQFKLTMYSILPKSGDVGSQNYSTPNSMEAIRDLVIAKKAINCSITDPEGSKVLMQANDGWTKILMQANLGTNSVENILLIAGDGMYTWSSDGGFKLAYSSSIFDGITDEYSALEDTTDYSKYTFSCDNPAKANFNLPAGVEFVDMTELEGWDTF
jgi:hypothetical protein